MSMGYMGYVKFDTDIILVTGANIAEVIDPIYSSSVRGAGWYHAGTSHYADDIIRYEGSIDFEMQTGLWTFLKNWLVEDRITSKTVLISPDGTITYTFTGGGTGDEGSLHGLWASSANFSASEGGLMTCSLGVLGLERIESNNGNTYKDKSAILDCSVIASSNPLNPSPFNENPYPFWKTTCDILKSGTTIFSVGSEVLDWSIDVSENPVVVYACNGVRGPVALFMGEMEASGNVTMFNLAGVSPIPSGCTADNTAFEVSLFSSLDTKKLNLPRVVFENEGNPVQGSDATINRTFNVKGFAGISDGTRRPAFYMAEV